jgi:hypothetical protein
MQTWNSVSWESLPSNSEKFYIGRYFIFLAKNSDDRISEHLMSDARLELLNICDRRPD